ncbi:MAG: two-component regulator propeller domain-containing protein [Kofleriaceae bacterium]|nr:two-component regulator propeller domain-containing protein [Kofleriaceae bacterium]
MGRNTLVIGSLLAGLALVSTSAHAKPEAKPLFPPVQFEKLGLEDGLPQIHTTSLAQDKRGFLWVGTQAGGIARYDGDKFVPYRTSADPTTLSSQFVTALAAHPDGSLWVGTGDAGLNVYDPSTNRFTRYKHEEGRTTSLASDAVTSLLIEADGTLWIGLGSGGVDRFDPATKGFVHVVSSEFGDGEITSIQSDGKDQLFIASNGGGVMAVATAKTAPTPAWLPLNEQISRNVTSLLLDSKGTLWIGTDDEGLYELPKGAAAPKSWRPRAGDRSSLSSDKLTYLFEDRDHSIWAATQFGLNEIDPTRTKITRYAPDPEYPMRTASYVQFATTVFQDNSGILWFGSLDFGLYKLDPLRRKFHHYESTPEFGIPMGFCEGKDGLIWAGTYSHGLYAYDFKNSIYWAYPSLGEGEKKLSLTDWLTTVHCAKDGTVWIGGSGLGLVQFDPASENFTQYPADPDGLTGPAADRIEQILEGPDGLYYLATWGGGLSQFDPNTKAFKLLSNAALLPSAYLHRILFDIKNPRVLWVAAAQGGLTRLDLAAGTSKSFRGPGSQASGASPILSSDNLLTLAQQSNGVLWLGTDGGGLNRFDPATSAVNVFNTETGMPSDVIYGILRDDKDRLWLTTARGLVRFNIEGHQFVTFTGADGLGSSEFSQNSYFKSSSGELFMGPLTGFNRFRPEEIESDSFVPPVVITKFRLFDTEAVLERPIWETPTLDLSYRDVVFSFEVAALAYAAPGQVKFQYMLEGFHSKWITTDRGAIPFTNLDPGDYVLKVKAANRHGVWSETPTSVAIHIQPPIWRTKAAYAVYVLLLVAAALLVIRFQRERLRRVERDGRLALVEQELELTGAVQSGFLPDANEISSESINLVGYYKPADSCSGDWWWHAQLGPTRHLVMVGDVTGHGPGPAMVTAAVATAFHVYHSTRTDTLDVSAMLDLLNREVLRVSKGKYQMSLAALDFDEATGKWMLHSAGAPPILTLDARGKHRVHFCPGTLLGDSNAQFGTLAGTLKPGERMLLYTDGIPEIALPNGNVMGIRRFAQMFERTRENKPSVAAAAIVNFAEETRAGQVQLDDWTFALLEWSGHAHSW